MLDWLNAHDSLCYHNAPVDAILRTIADTTIASRDDVRVISRLHGVRERLYRWGPTAVERKIIRRIDEMLGESNDFGLSANERWSSAAIADLEAFASTRRENWIQLLAIVNVSSGKPSDAWARKTSKLLAAIGPDEFASTLSRWLPLFKEGRAIPAPHQPPADLAAMLQVDDENAAILKGLIWCLASLGFDANVVRTLSEVAVSAYKKIPGIGPRCVKVGNACIHVLGSMPGTDGVAQLAILKSRIKLRNVQKEIEKALSAAALRAGIPKDELEEMSVPTYGLEEVGLGRERFGEVTAELAVTGTSSTEVRWLNAKGKPQKSPPASVKAEHAEELKELKNAAKDIERLLPALRDRLDRLMQHRKSWPLQTWRERHLDHPLMGTLARRLIWTFERRGVRHAVIFHNGHFINQAGDSIEVEADATVEIWHPIAANADEIQAWRALLESKGIVQPFKQAHRELYILTDAERTTNTYSNRFAAHIIRQHQFNALAAGRGWNNKLRLMVDDEYPPTTVVLPDHDLRAEFWVEGIGDNYGTDTNESGVYNYLATDQVRFYRMNAAQRTAHAGGGGYRVWGNPDGDQPLPLEIIPPLVLSEVMRDVDLFVGVASVGNDPNWFNGRSTNQTEYWNRYSFGDLSATAHTRREVLQRLIPRLAIADRCSFDDKFLIVRGEIRTYRIHLGSGNILMEPNDQYLCIVANRGTPRGIDRVFLPFEGDQTLAIIISKAMLLADDRAISDASILSQIQRA